MIPDTPDSLDNVVPPLPQPLLVQPGTPEVLTDTYILDHTVFAVPKGHLYTLPNVLVQQNVVRDTTDIDSFTKKIGWDIHFNFNDILRKKWMLIFFQNASAEVVL